MPLKGGMPASSACGTSCPWVECPGIAIVGHFVRLGLLLSFPMRAFCAIHDQKIILENNLGRGNSVEPPGMEPRSLEAA